MVKISHIIGISILTIYYLIFTKELLAIELLNVVLSLFGYFICLLLTQLLRYFMLHRFNYSECTLSNEELGNYGFLDVLLETALLAPAFTPTFASITFKILVTTCVVIMAKHPPITAVFAFVYVFPNLCFHSHLINLLLLHSSLYVIARMLEYIEKYCEIRNNYQEQNERVPHSMSKYLRETTYESEKID